MKLLPEDHDGKGTAKGSSKLRVAPPPANCVYGIQHNVKDSRTYASTVAKQARTDQDENPWGFVTIVNKFLGMRLKCAVYRQDQLEHVKRVFVNEAWKRHKLNFRKSHFQCYIDGQHVENTEYMLGKFKIDDEAIVEIWFKGYAAAVTKTNPLPPSAL